VFIHGLLYFIKEYYGKRKISDAQKIFWVRQFQRWPGASNRLHFKPQGRIVHYADGRRQIGLLPDTRIDV
jgi:hypothetical protein